MTCKSHLGLKTKYGTLLIRWGENLVTELIAGSKRRPLLSGYYHLMEMALHLSIQSGLLSGEGDFGQVRRHPCCSIISALRPYICSRLLARWRYVPIRGIQRCADCQSLAAGGFGACEALQRRAPERSAGPAPICSQHHLPSSGILNFTTLDCQRQVRAGRVVMLFHISSGGYLLLTSVLHASAAANPAVTTHAAAQELFRPLEVALQLGLQHPPLAARTLEALERLEAQSPAALQALVPDLVPLLEPYLAPVRDIVAAALPPAADNGYPSCSFYTSNLQSGICSIWQLYSVVAKDALVMHSITIEGPSDDKCCNHILRVGLVVWQGRQGERAEQGGWGRGRCRSGCKAGKG